MEQLSDIDNMLADESDNVSVSLNDMFKAMATLSGDAADGPARAAVFNALGTLANRFNASAKRLTALEKSTNTQIEQSAKDINSYTQQLAEVNKQLERARGMAPRRGSARPARCAAGKMSEHIGITVTEDKTTGRVDALLSDGRPLVSGDRAYKLQTSPSDADPNKTIVSYVDANENASPLDESSITKGRPGGLFKFRNEDLTIARQELDQIAFTMANRMNEQHAEGYTPDGDKGGDLFSRRILKLTPMRRTPGPASWGRLTLPTIQM